MSASVLIIDDHPLIRDGVRKSLNAAGFNCVGEAGSLKEAIAMIALHNPDVITVDLNLPDGNGLEIISWARKNSPTIAIIVLTLDDDLDLVSAASQSGAQAFISKSERRASCRCHQLSTCPARSLHKQTHSCSPGTCKSSKLTIPSGAHGVDLP
jgi:DNA-binding NarL/FixJ family response regulator